MLNELIVTSNFLLLSEPMKKLIVISIILLVSGPILDELIGNKLSSNYLELC